MKKSASRIIIALVVCALSAGAALAKVKSSTVTFGQDFTVGDTFVKKGTYKLVFDDKTNELSVIAKDKTVVAKTIAHLENRKNSVSAIEINLVRRGENHALVSMAFPDDKRLIVLEAGNAQSSRAQN
jgi:hypothetical protein